VAKAACRADVARACWPIDHYIEQGIILNDAKLAFDGFTVRVQRCINLFTKLATLLDALLAFAIIVDVVSWRGGRPSNTKTLDKLHATTVKACLLSVIQAAVMPALSRLNARGTLAPNSLERLAFRKCQAKRFDNVIAFSNVGISPFTSWMGNQNLVIANFPTRIFFLAHALLT
jgi:hypothetical protein